VLVGVELPAVDDREFEADYVSMALFAPTVDPVFTARQPDMEIDSEERLAMA